MSILIKNAIIVTVNSRDEILQNGSIIIEGSRIKDIGSAEDIARKYSVNEEIDASGMVAMPGLINGHIHTITALYKGTMVGFGFEKTAGEDTALAFSATPEIMLAASRLAAIEMLLSGTTLANVATDAMTFEVSSQTAKALGQAGMKAFVQTAIADIFGPTDLDADAQLAETEKLLREYQGKFDGRIHVSLGPVGDLTTSLKTMRWLANLAEREDLIVHMHVFPRWPTGIFSLLFRGRSPLGLLKSGELLNRRLVAVHFLSAKQGDIKALAKVGVSVVHCPSVWMNAAIGPKHWLPIKTLYRAGVNIVLGTDSHGGWVEGADMFTEMRNCALMSSFLYGVGSLKPADVLQMATINGARALGVEKETGSLEAGKRADIVLLKFDHPSVQPSSDIPAMIVYGTSSRDVQTVIIDGHVIVRNRQLLTIDEHEAITTAAQARKELYHRAGWTLGPNGATPPTTSWLERFPNKKIAKWGKRFARLKRLFSIRTSKMAPKGSLQQEKQMLAEMKGYRIYYEVKGEGEPILFIHGTPTSAFLWRKQIDALSKYYRVYALDLPGWARSGRPDNFDYKLESYADIIKQFLSKLGETKVILGVHDLGAAIGLTFLSKYPEMVSKLMLFDTFAFMPFSKRLQWKTLYGFFFRIPILGVLLHRLVFNFGVRRTNFFATLAFYDKKLATKELVRRYRELAINSQRADYETFLANGMDGITGAVEKNSLKVTIPTLILWAENDFLFPISAAQKLHINIAGSVLKIIPKCGHWLQEEKPDEVNRHILGFLNNIGYSERNLESIAAFW